MQYIRRCQENFLTPSSLFKERHMAFPTVVSASYPTSGQRIPNCAVPLQEGLKVSTITSEFDSGHSQRRRKSLPKRTFQLTYPVLTFDQYKTIRDFFLTVTNVSEFSWTHPVEKVTLNVKFSMDTFSGENFAYGKVPLYKLQLALEQVW